MKISTQEEYGIRCLLQVALHPRDGFPITAVEIAKAEGLSIPYANKLLHILKKARLVLSVRGANGGFKLGRSMNEITLFDALKALDGNFFEGDFCENFTGLKNKCVHYDSSCSLRAVWSVLKEYMGKIFGNITLQDLVGKNECQMKKHLHAEFGKQALCDCPSGKKVARLTKF